jgi:2,4-dienoyl-CoA reductase-like NADH-dependent reductase (Old Yellow Enzyme family)
VERIRTEVPEIAVATRISLFDCIPFEPGPGHVGIPMERKDCCVGNYRYAFGGDGSGLGYDLTEPVKLIRMAQELGVELICSTACSPYYNPHFQRPAYFPVSDGYLPPEEPILGAARQIRAVAQVKEYFADTNLRFIGSGCTCLQEYFVHVAQKAVRENKMDFAGYGRLVLSYPHIAADTLAGKMPDSRRICRTFGDCTTAPRHGLVSGCYPLDHFYKNHASCECLQQCKAALRKRMAQK